MILGTAGHIDHGKTALVRALTGVNTDRLPEERRRGITIELGFAPLALDGLGTVSVIDVPGHEAFIRTMVAGASGINAALMVIAADEGVMPQTREHLAILDVLGVSRMVVAITKSDLVERDWLALVREEVCSALASGGHADAEIVPVSALTGDGLPSLRSAIGRAFASARPAAADDLFRMPVDRAFTVQGTGTVITGSVWSGGAAVGDRVTIFPGGEEARVRGIQQHGQRASQAAAGSRAALALAGVPLARVARGATAVAGEGWAPTRLMRVDVTLLGACAEPGPKTRLRLHIGASDVECRLVLDRASSSGPRSLPARLVLRDPVIARAGDRFVLRLASPAATIGGGTVADPYAERVRRGGSLAYSAGAAQRLAGLLAAAKLRGVHEASLPVRLGVAPGDISPLVVQTAAVRAGERMYSADTIATLAVRVRAIVAEFHSREPLKAGISAQQLRALAGASAPALALVLGDDREPRLTVDEGLVAVAGRSTALDLEDSAVLRATLHDICAARLEPRDVAELTASFGGRVPALLRFAERKGELVRVEPDRFYCAAAIAELEARLRDGMQPGLAYSPARLRELVGVSRKYLIPLLEYCDRAGLTDRREGGRVLLE